MAVFTTLKLVFKSISPPSNFRGNFANVLTPSRSDVAVIKKLSKALILLNISLFDHLIAAEGRCISLRNLGFV